MEAPSDIAALEAISRDYSETPRKVLFVLGSGDGAAFEVFQAAAQQRHTSINPEHLAEIVRSLGQSNVAVYQVRLLED
jgi:hypothetical protein